MSDEPKGQILPDSAFGRVLTELARDAETIVEIGSWHGQGSTKCLANGLIRPTQRMWSIESDKAMHEEAKGYYGERMITFIHGRALDVVDQLPDVIDLILFDGSDDTTNDEFDTLAHLCHTICLDDTKEMKNRRQAAYFRSPHGLGLWMILHDITTERNGWMVARRL